MKTAEETRDIYYLCGYYQNILSLITTEDLSVSVDYKSEEEQIIITFCEREDVRERIVSQHIVNVHLSSVRSSILDFTNQFLVPFLEESI